ncbi:hypothetical protein BDR26DRAFT_862870 [Obelidium mucronatum]|nr:hypothetical protein BDR26DRAFT_862870 [Obelidium mucronatum]
MPDESEVFQTYEKEYSSLFDSISRKVTLEIASAPTLDQKKRLINQTNRELEEADEIVRNRVAEMMTSYPPLSCRSAKWKWKLFRLPPQSGGKLQPRVKSFKDEIKKAKKDLVGVNTAISDRDQLLGGAGSSSGSHLVDVDNHGNDHRSKMLQGTERLQEGSRRLEEAKRMAIETENMGIETLGSLNQQREQILRTKDRLTVADSFITKSQGVLRGMHETMMANKWLTYGIIAALMLLILIVIYFKWFASSK